MSGSVITAVSATSTDQPWLCSAAWDSAIIFAPAIVSAFIVLAFRQQFENCPVLPLWAWVCFVLMVDVAHVYATLFRTYLDPAALSKNRALLIGIPIACWFGGCLLYACSALAFWRVLAYLAVFHFIRQQYGFVAIYSRKDPPAFHGYRWLDATVVYLATIYPLLFWHTHLPRTFNWFVDGDFVTGIPSLAANVGLVIYGAAALAYLAKETILYKTSGFFNVPRNLLIASTALSWWVGIITVNSDFSFTFTNVLSHGIPYIGLVWLYQQRRNASEQALAPRIHPPLSETSSDIGRRSKPAPWLFSVNRSLVRYVPAFLVFLITLAFIEEGLWDGFVWREHLSVFSPFWRLPQIQDSILLAFLVPFLSLPQSTHYVLDGFIWRVKDTTSIWST